MMPLFSKDFFNFKILTRNRNLNMGTEKKILNVNSDLPALTMSIESKFKPFCGCECMERQQENTEKIKAGETILHHSYRKV